MKPNEQTLANRRSILTSRPDNSDPPTITATTINTTSAAATAAGRTAVTAQPRRRIRERMSEFQQASVQQENNEDQTGADAAGDLYPRPMHEETIKYISLFENTPLAYLVIQLIFEHERTNSEKTTSTPAHRRPFAHVIKSSTTSTSNTTRHN